MIRMIKDIEGIYSKKLKIHNIGIANLKLLCGLGSEVSHDALDDSIDLKEVVRYLDTKGCPDYMVQAMKTYLSDKELYCRYRRFHEKWDEVPGNLLEKSKELLLELEKINSMEAKALRDDIHVICTGKDTIFRATCARRAADARAGGSLHRSEKRFAYLTYILKCEGFSCGRFFRGV